MELDSEKQESRERGECKHLQSILRQFCGENQDSPVFLYKYKTQALVGFGERNRQLAANHSAAILRR